MPYTVSLWNYCDAKRTSLTFAERVWKFTDLKISGCLRQTSCLRVHIMVRRLFILSSKTSWNEIRFTLGLQTTSASVWAVSSRCLTTYFGLLPCNLTENNRLTRSISKKPLLFNHTISELGSRTVVANLFSSGSSVQHFPARATDIHHPSGNIRIHQWIII